LHCQSLTPDFITSPQLGGLFVIVNETILHEQREQYAGEDLNYESAVAVSELQKRRMFSKLAITTGLQRFQHEN
jgi:hypothetical protein